MSFLDFLKTMGGNISSVFSPIPQTSSDAVSEALINAPINTIGYSPGGIDHDPSDFYTDEKSIIYPQDLFDVTLQNSYILFLVREPTVQSAKILKRIALYMPPAIKVNYGANWEEIQMALLRSSSGGENLVNRAKTYRNTGDTAAFNDITSIGTDVFDFTVTNAVRGIGGLIDDTTIGRQLEKELGLALNPHASQKFNGINFRNFQFDFQLFARSENESESIRKIIKMFKWAMHPEAMKTKVSTLQKLYWDYPNTFDIYLITPSTKYMFNISQSALVDMDVTYGEEGASFFQSTGAPVQINLSLSFREMEILTKNRIEQNY
jgi:hypothetical protein